MRIERIVCTSTIEDKLATKHRVQVYEAEEALFNTPRVRFAEKGNVPGEDVYAAFGRTFSGRYLAVFFVYKPESATAIIISARDMTARERSAYGRK